MAIKIRLRQQGRNNHRSFRFVVTDTRRPRDGAYIEAIGWYDPKATSEERILSIKPDRAAHWLAMGAEISERVESLLTRAAPDVIKQYHAKKLAHRTKMGVKRRASRKAKTKNG